MIFWAWTIKNNVFSSNTSLHSVPGEWLTPLCVLQMVVAGMAAHTDISRAHEVANEVRRIHKQLKEAQDMAAVYNNRERLFGMPITNVSVSVVLF